MENNEEDLAALRAQLKDIDTSEIERTTRRHRCDLVPEDMALQNIKPQAAPEISSSRNPLNPFNRRDNIDKHTKETGVHLSIGCIASGVIVETITGGSNPIGYLAIAGGLVGLVLSKMDWRLED